MKIIKTTNNKEVLVDDEDYPYLNRFSWTASNKGFDGPKLHVQMCKQRNNKYTGIAMHELVIDLVNADAVGFKNGNPLDNRKENLFATDKAHMMQMSMKRRMKNASSKYKGLTWRKHKKYWEVRITKDFVVHYIGKFKSERQAALAYNARAKELYGEYAYQNKVK